MTFSPTPRGEHSTAFLGHGAAPPLDAMQRLASQASFASWAQARDVIARIVDVLQGWPKVAAELGVRTDTIRLIGERLDAVRGANRELLAR